VRPLQAQPTLEGYSDAGLWLGHIPATVGLSVRVRSEW